MRFFSFAIADSMFSGNVTVARKTLTASEAVDMVSEGVTSALNPSLAATIAAAAARFGLRPEIPETAPRVSLVVGDSLIVMGVRGLPRLGADRHEYTPEEIAGASFEFSLWEVIS